MIEDVFQSRYSDHQKRKREELIAIMRYRHSDRMFGDKDVDQGLIDEVLEAGSLAPSSCDRHGVRPVVVTQRDEKALLGGILVGGVGWVHRAKAIILLMGDPIAYKAPGEVLNMPFIDAGVMAENMLLSATAIGLAATFVNPNIRAEHKPFFRAAWGDGVFGGAVALGWPMPPDWVFETS